VPSTTSPILLPFLQLSFISPHFCVYRKWRQYIPPEHWNTHPQQCRNPKEEHQLTFLIIIHHRISHFSASAGKHSPILGCVINRIRLDGLICNFKSFLQLLLLLLLLLCCCRCCCCRRHCPSERMFVAKAAIV
jgi:hypothetical protein